MITDSPTCRPQRRPHRSGAPLPPDFPNKLGKWYGHPSNAGHRYPTKTAGALSYGCCHKHRLMSENLSDTKNDECPENDTHHEREEDRLTNRPFLLCRQIAAPWPREHIVHAAVFRGSHNGLHPLEGVTSEAPVLCPLARGVKLMESWPAWPVLGRLRVSTLQISHASGFCTRKAPPERGSRLNTVATLWQRPDDLPVLLLCESLEGRGPDVAGGTEG